MKENKYDNESFFLKYSQMERSQKGLSWKKFSPTFKEPQC